MTQRSATFSFIAGTVLAATSALTSAQSTDLPLDTISGFESASYVEASDSFSSLFESPEDTTLHFQNRDATEESTRGQLGRGHNSVNIHKNAIPEQDILTVVPLPGAAFAGMGVLAGLFGVRSIRSNRQR